MNIQAIEKSIKQMRQFFGFLAVLEGLAVLLTLYSCATAASSGGNASFLLISFLILAGITVEFARANSALRTPNPKAYALAKECSVVLLFGFPILTFFGISYLIKLSKPEMKQAFSVLK